MNLALDVIAGLSLESGFHFLADLITLLLLEQGRLVILLDHFQFLLQLFLGLDTSDHPGIVLFDLLGDLLFLRQASDLQVPAFTASLQVQGHLPEDGVDVRRRLLQATATILANLTG